MNGTAALFSAALLAISSAVAPAGTFIYDRTTSNTSGTADQWMAGTNWNASPVSAADTTLTFGNGVQLGSAATIFTNNNFGGDFQLNRLNFTYAGPLSGAAPSVTVSGDRLEFVNDGVINPVLTFNAGGSIKPLFIISNALLLTNDLTVAATTAGTLAGVIGGGGSLTKSNAGTLTLSGTNTYSGGTILSGGALNIDNGGAGGTSSAIGTGTFTINAGIIQNRSGTDVTLSTNNAQVWGGNFTFGNSIGVNGSLNLGTGAVTLTGNRTISLASGDDTLTVGGAIGDSGNSFGLTIEDSGNFALALTGASTYSGGTIIARGGLNVAQVGNAGAAGLGTGGITIGSGSETATLRYTGTGETTNKVITLGGTGIMQINQAGTGLLRLTADIAVTGAVPKTLALTAGAGTGEIAGLITGNNINLVKETQGTWILSGANTFTNKVTIASGTLSVGSINSVVGGAPSSNLGAPTTVANGTIDFGGFLPLPGVTVRGPAILQYTGAGETTDRVIHLKTALGGIIEQAGTGLLKFTSNLMATGGADLFLAGSTTGMGEFAGLIANAPSVGVTSVAKSGTGTWTLSAANTYTGETRVFSGTLLINGDQSAATGAVTVNATGTLGGTGTIGGAVTVNGGTITGGQIGSVGALTLNGTATFIGTVVCQDCDNADGASASASTSATNFATYLVDITGGMSDKLAVGGLLDLSNSLDQIIFNGSPDGSTTYVLATYTSLSGSFDFGSAPAGYQLVYGMNQLDLAPVPEAGTLTTGALAAMTLFVLARKSRRSKPGGDGMKLNRQLQTARAQAPAPQQHDA